VRTIINIDVPELAAGIQFYTAALGLKLSRVLDEDTAELMGASSSIYLLANAGASKATAQGEARDYSRHWTPVHIDYVVANIEKAAEQAINAGAVQESECIAWRGSRCITFADPFGNGFCLIEFTHETYSDA
jgi:predicted enzyme related to lactoylglutathione lyase